MYRANASSLSSRTAIATVLLLASGFAAAGDVAFDDHCAPRLSLQQQRLFDKANEGTDVLRRFLTMRRFELQLDVYDTAVWAEDVRKNQLVCLQALAGHDGAHVAQSNVDAR